MKLFLLVLLLAFIIAFWYIANIFNRPKLNRISNYYEEDLESRTISNIFIGLSIILSFIIGLMVS